MGSEVKTNSKIDLKIDSISSVENKQEKKSVGPFSLILKNIGNSLQEYMGGQISEKVLRKQIWDSVNEGKKGVRKLLVNTIEEKIKISNYSKDLTDILLNSAESIVKIAELKLNELEKK